MRSVLQLIRQPLRTLAGILVVALAVSVLSVSVSQTLAAANTAEQLNETFLTVALPTSAMSADGEAWIEELKAEYPGIVEADASHGLASAYIPELTPDNYTQHLFMTDWLTQNAFYLPSPRAVHSAAMLVVRLEWIEEAEQRPTPVVVDDILGYWQSGETNITLTGTIEEVVGLQEGYADPTGYTARLTLTLTDPDEWEALKQELIPGERYIFFGMNYYDTDWELRCNMAKLMTWRFEPELLDWDMDTYQVQAWKWPGMNSTGTNLIQVGDEYFVEWNGEWYPISRIPTKIRVKIGDLYHGMQGDELEKFRSITMTVIDRAAAPQYGDYYWAEEVYEITNEDGSTSTVTQPVITRDELERDYTYTDEDGNTATLTKEEYEALYKMPTFARLEGTVEEFLADGNNALWQKALDDLTVNNNTFPIIGVENLSWMAGFATGKAEITEGRAFTEEELTSGARVCVLAKSLAEANGLSVGDTIDPQFYENDELFPYQKYSQLSNYNPTEISGVKSFTTTDMAVVNSTAYYYYGDSTPLQPAEPYTIVGLYEQTEPWGDVDYDFYAFTPNTIFVPESSVSCGTVYPNRGQFRTLVVRSDSLRELQLLTVEDNMDDIFYYYDNGYSAVASTLSDYRQAAELLLPIGLVVYAIVILLFLFLFPGRQGKDLAMMSSFGAQNRRRVWHVVVSCLGIVIPGTAIGTGVGLLLWQRVSAELQAWVDTVVVVELDPLSLWAVAAVQVVVVALLTAILAVPMSGRANLMKRK